jgi:hypothetical protein
MATTTPQEGPPPGPWEKGDHDTYSSITLEVKVCRDQHGRIYSMHQLQDELDHTTAMQWRTGGQEQTAFALLVEATRREALLSLLVRLTKDPDVAAKVASMTEEERQAWVAEVSAGMQEQMANSIRRLADAAVMEALDTVTG